jgi:hypothetical protein
MAMKCISAKAEWKNNTPIQSARNYSQIHFNNNEMLLSLQPSLPAFSSML